MLSVNFEPSTESLAILAVVTAADDNLAVETVPSLGVTFVSASLDFNIPKNVIPVPGASVNVIVLADELIVYATSGSCKTPPILIKTYKALDTFMSLLL